MTAEYDYDLMLSVPARAGFVPGGSLLVLALASL